jgi:signal transduction histidine kinase
MMATMFFYGSHVTSTFDVGLVMSVLILIFISTGMRGLITLAQITYYITLAYDIYQMITMNEKFDSLVITRTIMHFIVVSVICDIARGIIKKWVGIMTRSEQEKWALAEAAERLNDFLANISHEIRTPINAVIGLTGVCIEKEKDEEIKNDLMSVSSAGMRVGEQISDILDYSEIDRKILVRNEDDYMLASVLNDLVAQLRPYMHQGVELVIDVEPAIPSVMHGDVNKIKRILWHLIMNGLKYTRAGGIYVRIDSIKEEYGINLCIEVTDTGIGMSPSELERVS